MMISLSECGRAKKEGKKWAVLTAYDALAAGLLEAAGIDWILVGDSVGMVLLGYDSTTEVTMDEMIHHAKAVRRGAPKTPIIGDLPLKGIEKGPRQALASARRFLEEAGCDAVKLEWGPRALETMKLFQKNKIPVMGHVGLTPQTASKKFRVRGQDAAEAAQILDAAKQFEKLSAFSVVLECVPAPVAERITRSLKIPTIGIGAGAACDGQVLVFHDMAGRFNKFHSRFVKRYADTERELFQAVRDYVKEVKTGKFPEAKHAFSMKREAWAAFAGSAS